jgi:hypothetical protein
LIFIYRKKKIFLTKILKTFFWSVIGLIIAICIIFVWQLKSDEYFGIKKNRLHYSSIISYTYIRLGFKIETDNFNKYEKLIFNNNINKITNELENSKSLDSVDEIKLKKKLIDFQTRIVDASKNTENTNYLFNSTPERFEIYKLILNELKEFDIKSIILGRGLNSILVQVKDYNLQKNKITNPESHILQIIYEVGLTGFFLYCILILKVLRILNTERKLLFIGLLYLCIFNSYQESILYASLLGIILGSNNNKLNKFKTRKNVY